ncbi:unnamed protein product [Protopolystoma xenopodis]|uniref:long-chain-fatty-acid--CoA ligase n=1 Tax=Protopolystoma xenopodis TaxID=117903 RepID=A0A3S5AHB9_9PLAT|nr:unnamed protein product [Protopolystoma xenopodis]
MIKLTLGTYTWETYGEAEVRVSNLAAGIRKLIGPTPVVPEDRQPVAIFSETRAEWLYAAMAIFRLNRPLVTLYSTLGDDALLHGFTESQVSF